MFSSDDVCKVLTVTGKHKQPFHWCTDYSASFIQSRLFIRAHFHFGSSFTLTCHYIINLIYILSLNINTSDGNHQGRPDVRLSRYLGAQSICIAMILWTVYTLRCSTHSAFNSLEELFTLLSYFIILHSHRTCLLFSIVRYQVILKVCSPS